MPSVVKLITQGPVGHPFFNSTKLFSNLFLYLMLARLWQSAFPLFGVSTELITKGKQRGGHRKDIRVLTFRALALHRQRVANVFMVANLSLDINSVDKPNIRFFSTSTLHHSFFRA